MKSIQVLFQETANRYWRSKAALLIAATIFGSILVFVQVTLLGMIDFGTRTTALKMGIGQQRMEELNQRMASGDEEAFNEVLAELDNAAERLSSLPETERALVTAEHSAMLLKTVGPFVLLLYLLTIAVLLLSSTYYFVLATLPSGEGVKALKQSFHSMLPIVGIGVWTMLRSFVWIPFIGIFFGLYFLPRFAFAPVIYLEEKTGIFESVRLSKERTQGQWGHVITRYIIAIVVLWIFFWLFTLLASFTGQFASLLILVFSQLQVAFTVFFTVLLAESLKQK